MAKKEWLKLNMAILIVGVIIILGVAGAFAFSGDGDGSLESPFVITNCTQLQEMQDNLTADYSLGSNINMALEGCGEFTPMGDRDFPFAGNCSVG